MRLRNKVSPGNDETVLKNAPFASLSVQSGSERSPTSDVGELGGDQDHRLRREHRQPVSQTLELAGSPVVLHHPIRLMETHYWGTRGKRAAQLECLNENKNLNNSTSAFFLAPIRNQGVL